MVAILVIVAGALDTTRRKHGRHGVKHRELVEAGEDEEVHHIMEDDIF